MTDIKAIAEGLTEAQRRMVLASEPGGFGCDDCSTGVEIRGSQYRTAMALQRRGLGTYSHGSSCGDIYFNTDGLGLAVRAYLKEQSHDAR